MNKGFDTEAFDKRPRCI